MRPITLLVLTPFFRHHRGILPTHHTSFASIESQPSMLVSVGLVWEHSAPDRLYSGPQ